jgi:lysophospholipase L1-like esterase
MKRLLAVCACLLPLIVSTSQADPVLKDSDTVALCGDSITQQGVYSVFIEDYLRMCQPVKNVQPIQCGWGGGSAGHFADIMDRTSLTFSPTVATIFYGMNDGGYSIINETIEKNYRDGLTRAVKKLKAKGVRTIIIGTPGGVDAFYFKNPKTPATADEYNQTLGRLGEIAREVAKAEGCVFADVHTPVMQTMTKAKTALGEKYPVLGSTDGVHSGPNGHLIMAYAFLKAMGFDGNIGTIEFDATKGQGTATEGHKVLSSQPGEIVIESVRYPYCFQRGSDHPTGPTASILPYLPFNEDLNRYVLKVTNLSAPKAKITWGKESKEFTAEQLAQGINLAAEFLDNPFSVPFAEVSKQTFAKQSFETLFIKDYLGKTQPELSAVLPAKADNFKQVEGGFRQIHDGLMDNVSAAIVPVKHTIKVEAIP